MRSLPGAYDEASSGSEGDDSSVDFEPEVTTKQRRRELEGRTSDDDDSESSDSDEDSDESDSTSDSDNGDGSDSDSSGSAENDDDRDNEESDKKDDGSDSDDNNASDSDDPDLPLHERVQRMEQKGRVRLPESRQRKAKALEAAARKLAKYKKEKRKQQQAQAGNEDSSDDDEDENEKRPHKRSKHAPTEASSKRKDFYRRGAPKLNESGLGVEIGAHRYKALDPRVSNLSGHFNEDQFTQNYQFLQTMRNQEIKKLKQHIAARKLKGRRGQAHRQRLGITNKGSLEEDQEKLKELQQLKADWERNKLNRQAKRAVKQKLKSQVEEKGQDGVYFLKRKEKRRMELEAKMDLIRKSKGQQAVDKAINRRRKKQKSKDSKIFAR